MIDFNWNFHTDDELIARGIWFVAQSRSQISDSVKRRGATVVLNVRDYGPISLQGPSRSGPWRTRPAMKSSSETLNYAGECRRSNDRAD